MKLIIFQTDKALVERSAATLRSRDDLLDEAGWAVWREGLRPLNSGRAGGNYRPAARRCDPAQKEVGLLQPA